MSKVLVCDRCGKRLEHGKKFHIGSLVYRYQFFTETALDDKDYDLCPVCEKAFAEFMKGPSEGSTEKKAED